MIYIYSCNICPTRQEHYFTIDTYPGSPIPCRSCGLLMAKRIFTVPYLATRACGFAAHYNEGLGQVVHSSRELKAICKEKGLTEVGNERIKTIKRRHKKLGWESAAKAAQDLGLAEEARDDLDMLKQNLSEKHDITKRKGNWTLSDKPPIIVDISEAKRGI